MPACCRVLRRCSTCWLPCWCAGAMPSRTTARSTAATSWPGCRGSRSGARSPANDCRPADAGESVKRRDVSIAEPTDDEPVKNTAFDHSRSLNQRGLVRQGLEQGAHQRPVHPQVVVEWGFLLAPLKPPVLASVFSSRWMVLVSSPVPSKGVMSPVPWAHTWPVPPAWPRPP